MKLAALALTIAAIASTAYASCPNACSGHGTCGSNDECSCFRNWMANDCSERVCPFGISHTTTPQGDLNMDGDRYDNSHKAIVYKTGNTAGSHIQAFVSHLDNKLTFAFADVSAHELIVGDEIRIQGYDFVITAVDADGVTYTLDKDQTWETDGLSGSVFKRVSNLASPGGTWESWPGDAVEKTQDEGHFYMECSNQGMCDRGTGMCECFEAYTGRACSSTACPNDCSGRGQCATVAEMAIKQPLLSSNTIGVTRGSHFVSTRTTVTDLAKGDRVYLGEQADFDGSNMYTVTRTTDSTSGTAGFYVTPRSQVSLPHGSALYKSPTYSLWDAVMVKGCICDAGYSGHDCSARKCVSGHDPLDVKGEDKTNTHSSTSTTNPSLYTRRNERQMLSMDSTHGAVSGTFKLTFTDSTGAKHTTGSIGTAPMLSSTVRVGAPNAIDDTHCKEANKANMAMTNNGFEGCYKVVYFTPDLPEDDLAVGDYIRVGQDIRHVHTLTRNTLTGGWASATVSSQFSSTFGEGSYAYRQTAEKAVELALEGLPNKACGAITASRSMSSATPVFDVDGTVAAGTLNDGSGAVTSSSTSTITAATDKDAVALGDIVRVHTGVGQMQATAVTYADAKIATIVGSARAFKSTSDNGQCSGGTVLRDNGFNYKVSFDGNSGDVADLVCDSSGLRPVYRMSAAGYVSKEEPDRIYYVDPTQGSSQPAYTVVTHADRSHPETVSAGDVVFIGEQRCEVVDTDDRAISSDTESVTKYDARSIVCKDALQANAHSTNNAIFTHETLEVVLGSETVECASTDTPPLRFVRTSVDDDTDALLTVSADGLCHDGEACVDVYTYNGEARLVTHAERDAVPTVSSTQPNTLLDQADLSVGDRVAIDTLGHTQEIRTVDYISILAPTATAGNNYFTVSQPFSAAHANKPISLYWKGSTGSAVCSGRGICDEGAGDCQCFRGYTGQACQIQNALAA